MLAFTGGGLVGTEFPSPLKEELTKDAQEVRTGLAEGSIDAVTA